MNGPLDLKLVLASSLPTLLIHILPLTDIDTPLKLHLIDSFWTLLKSNNKDILNALLDNTVSIFRQVYDHKKTIEKSVLIQFNEKIKKGVFGLGDRVLASNWRYHLRYYECLSNIATGIMNKEDAVLEIFPLFMKGLRHAQSTLPVKKFIVSCMANSLT